MDLMIRAYEERSTIDANGFDDSFLVESELVLSVGNGSIRYEIAPVPPYVKDYRGCNSKAPDESDDQEMFLAFLDDSVVGRIVLSVGWHRYAWVEDIAVDARCRRLGVGRALLDHAVDWAAERRLPGIRLETQSNNVSACRFYEAYGFHLGGFDRDLYRGLDKSTTEIALFWYLPIPVPSTKPRN